jgi:hypothetical protein
VKVDLDRQLIGWGRQTIAYALSIRAQDDGQPLETPAQVQHAQKATDKVTAELWDEARKDCKLPGQLMIRFTRAVLDWVEEHRRVGST